MKPKLLLLNGNPGMGKSTLAQRYVDDHPMALNLEIDRLWFMMGQWQASRPKSDSLKYNYAALLANAHIAEGYDVIVPQLFESSDICNKFERIARVHNAVFKEFVLLSDVDDAIERCKARARALGYADGFRPGGVLDTSGRELKLQSMHENVMQVINEHLYRISLWSGRRNVCSFVGSHRSIVPLVCHQSLNKRHAAFGDQYKERGAGAARFKPDFAANYITVL